MGKFYERKKAGLCTKCGRNPATGTRKILCDVCREVLRRQHAQEAEPVQYYGDKPRDYSKDRG